jgi:hypothetical protein
VATFAYSPEIAVTSSIPTPQSAATRMVDVGIADRAITAAVHHANGVRFANSP